MSMVPKRPFRKPHEILEQLVSYVGKCSACEMRIDLVERELFDLLLGLGRALLAEYIALAGDGDVGKTLSKDDEVLRRVEKLSRKYRSIFGVLDVERWVYACRKGQKGYSPLDEKLSLPADEQSYVLEDWQQRFCIQDAFGHSVESLRDLLGIAMSKRTAERTNQKLSAYVEPFRESQRASLSEEEEEVLVVTADGKGVPMRHTLEERMGLPEPAWRRCRRKQQEQKADQRAIKRPFPGRGKVHKQMAFVGAVYTIARWERTAEDIMNDLFRKQSHSDRPHPCNKHLRAEMTYYRHGEKSKGQPRLFVDLARQVQQRDPDCKKPLVCLMDGQRSLWDLQRTWLARAVCIVDIFHVMEYLWDAAYCFHPKSSRCAEQMVEHYLQMLLEGKVSHVIGSLQRKLANLTAANRKKLGRVLTYLRNNCHHMKYDEYLKEGYPIGSGVVEGACRYLVRDRMERTGMRWEIEGAQAMLHTRSAFLNGEWDDLIEYRIRKEQSRLYRQAA